MTLDEAIKYLEKMIEIGETYEVSTGVEEYRQLAEWLKELKRLKEQEPGEDWYGVPSYEMSLEQAQQAVKDLRKMLASYLLQEQEPWEDAISRQAAIAAVERIFDRCEEIEAHLPEGDPDRVGYKMYPDWLTVWKYLHQLSSVQPENADCIYCHEDSDGYVKPIEKNCHAFVRFGMYGWELSLKANGWHGSAKIKYCPMCGRNLRQEVQQ